MAKQQKSGYLVYDPKHDKHSPHRLTLMAELRHAIDADQLVLHYQPKINIQTGQVTEVEALVRWQHPQYDLMSPDDFIPLAERTGLIKPLTLWVLTRALQQHNSWKEAGLDIGVAVNMSAHGLLDLELPDLIAGRLASHNCSPDRLILEITETTIMVNQDTALQILTRLADMGVRLSIDDFGTGYSSLSYLSKLPVQEIKIDKSFVMDMIENDKHAMIVRATIDLAHNLGLDVIGEGTCSADILQQLQRLGCDAAQGDQISKPIGASDFQDWLKRSSWKPRLHAASEREEPVKPAAAAATTAPAAPPRPAKKAADKESWVSKEIKELEDYIGQVDLPEDLDKPSGRKRAGR
jgi:EAL domain-containing protein (putative c-di-GMP-specific phosphodiesterase class I)